MSYNKEDLIQPMITESKNFLKQITEIIRKEN